MNRDIARAHIAEIGIIPSVRTSSEWIDELARRFVHLVKEARSLVAPASEGPLEQK
jgi:hypothetical protein